MSNKTEKLLALLDGQPVIPVLKIARAADAVPLARALARGGLKAIEITLRTPEALEAIRRVAGEVEEAVVGAGTILDSRQFAEAEAAGSRFIVSPGLTRELLAADRDSAVPLLPGAVTPGEIMTAREAGLDFLKFFPAEQAGGIKALRALAGPFPQVRFCPTGGIGEANAVTWLSEPNVLAVGGSWLCPAADIKSGNWAGITAMCQRTMKMLQSR